MSADVIENYTDLAPLLQRQTEAGRTIALTNGCFDLLHVGHIRLLQAAANEADLLIVALNSDESVRGNKGQGRPLVPLAERMEVLAALECVHYVTSFTEPTADALLETLRPTVYCKGTDWTADQVPERATAEKIKARIAICGDAKSHSSSELAERLSS
ncbi:MAG: rfaE bifunctional protein nucleotidyltransferase chain/domain [Planctomycetota bacterium]|jgi:rfaE bifunctional protein nucleotidyltransferase chain/domain